MINFDLFHKSKLSYVCYMTLMIVFSEPGIGNALPDISLLPMSPHSPLQPSINGAPGLFMGSGNNSSLDLYMRSLTSPTMSILSQARGLSPRHSMQGRLKEY